VVSPRLPPPRAQSLPNRVRRTSGRRRLPLQLPQWGLAATVPSRPAREMVYMAIPSSVIACPPRPAPSLVAAPFASPSYHVARIVIPSPLYAKVFPYKTGARHAWASSHATYRYRRNPISIKLGHFRNEQLLPMIRGSGLKPTIRVLQPPSVCSRKQLVPPCMPCSLSFFRVLQRQPGVSEKLFSEPGTHETIMRRCAYPCMSCAESVRRHLRVWFSRHLDDPPHNLFRGWRQHSAQRI
jgi:hypothetical protein